MLVLGLLITSMQGDVLLEVLANVHPAMLAAALLLLPFNLTLQYSKWRVLVHSRCPSVTPRELRASLLLGFTFGIITPARLGEFGGRAVAISGADRLALVGLTAVDKIATMFVTLLVGVIALVIFTARHPIGTVLTLNASLLLVLLLIVAIAAIAVYVKRRKYSDNNLPEALGSGGFVRRRIGEMRHVLRGVDAGQRRQLVLLSLLFYLTFLLQFYLLLRAFGPVDAISALAGIGTIMLLKTVAPPVTLGELGIREGASVYVLGHAGILATTAFNASLLLFAINILLPSLAGLAVLLRRPRTAASADAIPPGTRTAPVDPGSAEEHA